ncbi:hypothetical protein INS49_005649 [Diaporthe citri]|uniref:uncharacterized protein n=1 Tax=Diaporthe citri TaxID=83186 RepID=UPI001C804069|nr:uncharacterized protein INS49_005649 [Diaporthe citri]KAG6353468.1 hypothetical protein INS49_005649 [Diaporthe citri]
MRRLRVKDPSGLCWACGGSIPYTASSQKRSFIVSAPRGIAVKPSSGRRRRRRRVLFELPDVVLDLDAEDSPYVRPFNDQDAAQQRAKWGYDPVFPEVEQRVDKLRTDILKDGISMRQLLAARHHPFKISDHDVLSVALLGGNASASLADGEAVDEGAHRRNALLEHRDQALHANGIPERILGRDANTIIHFMLHRQRLASASHETSSTSSNGDTNTSDTFDDAFQHCKGIVQLERLCSNSLSSGPEAIGPASMDHVARRLEDLKNTNPKRHTQHALKLVNNFTMRLLSANADLSPSLSLLGLVMAANLGLLPAIMQYLHICLSQGFIGKSQDKPEMLGEIGQGILGALERGDGSARGTRPELFTLLTGRTHAGSAVQPALFGSSVSSSAEDPHTHHIYVQLLGQLGACRLLWHSWKRGAKKRMRHYEPYYYAAFVRCAEVLRDAKSVAGLDCATATGDLERDAELDLQAIDALDAHHASSTSSEAPYAWHFEDPLSWDEISKVFESPGIHQAVARMNDLITSADME